MYVAEKILWRNEMGWEELRHHTGTTTTFGQSTIILTGNIHNMENKVNSATAPVFGDADAHDNEKHADHEHHNVDADTHDNKKHADSRPAVSAVRLLITMLVPIQQ